MHKISLDIVSGISFCSECGMVFANIFNNSDCKKQQEINISHEWRVNDEYNYWECGRCGEWAIREWGGRRWVAVGREFCRKRIMRKALA